MSRRSHESLSLNSTHNLEFSIFQIDYFMLTRFLQLESQRSVFTSFLLSFTFLPPPKRMDEHKFSPCLLTSHIHPPVLPPPPTRGPPISNISPRNAAFYKGKARFRPTFPFCFCSVFQPQSGAIAKDKGGQQASSRNLLWFSNRSPNTRSSPQLPHTNPQATFRRRVFQMQPGEKESSAT